MGSVDKLSPVAAFNRWCEEHDKENEPAMMVPRMLVDPAVTSLTVELFRLYFMLGGMTKALKELMPDTEVDELIEKLQQTFSVAQLERDAKTPEAVEV